MAVSSARLKSDDSKTVVIAARLLRSVRKIAEGECRISYAYWGKADRNYLSAITTLCHQHALTKGFLAVVASFKNSFLGDFHILGSFFRSFIMALSKSSRIILLLVIDALFFLLELIVGELLPPSLATNRFTADQPQALQLTRLPWLQTLSTWSVSAER